MESAQTPRQDLGDWLGHVLDGEAPDEERPLWQFAFPSDECRSEFIRRIADFSSEQITRVLRHLLLPSCTLGRDEWRLEWLAAGGWSEDATRDAEAQGLKLSTRVWELDRRLIRYARDPDGEPPPWEGITWILDLLPSFPEGALAALSNYILAHSQALPDGRLAGLADAEVLIRAVYIGVPGESDADIDSVLAELSPRDFEHLIERYFAADGYQTKLTPPSKDGGRDIEVDKTAPPPARHALVECKNWGNRVGVGIVRGLRGVLTSRFPNGVVVSRSGFTGPAVDLAKAHRELTLLGGAELHAELNRVLGRDWPLRIDRLLRQSRKAEAEQADADPM